jgi:branched-chain amino acid:cation transporter, LIVCS family
MKKSSKDFIIIGFALFAMFFGAGNLIFPPYLGKMVGSNYLIAILGFVATGVGLPLLGIIACAKSGGSFEDMSSRVGKTFSVIATTALILALGPMLAIPRTAATTYELAVKPMLPGANPLVAVIIYFVINLAFVLRPSSIIDSIGKVLTPVLLVMLSSIVIKGIITPMDSIAVVEAPNVLSASFLEGYQTMDAMASVIFSAIILASITAKGYTKRDEIMKITIKAGVVAVVGLGFIYGGLLYLGAQTVNILPGDIVKTQLVTEIARRTLGPFGSVALGLSVALACLTTSIGLTAAGAEFFNRLSNGRLSYNTNAITISIISIIVGRLGVDAIVKFAFPILSILYPIVIVFIIITLAGKRVRNNRIVAATVYTTLVVSIFDTVNAIGFPNFIVRSILNVIPLSNIGFPWVIPAIIAFTFSSLLIKGEVEGGEKPQKKVA